MTDPIQVASGIITALKKALEVSKRLKDAEMQGVLLDAQEQVLELKEEVLDLRAENAKLKGQLDVTATLKYDRGAYWSMTGDSRDGPFCSRCWDVDRRLVRMHPTGFGGYLYDCPACHESVKVESAPKMPTPPPLHFG